MKKKIAAIACVALSCATLFGGCGSGKKADDGNKKASSENSIESMEKDLQKGWYTYTGESSANMPCFYKFKEDGTFYGSYYNGAITEAGTYKLEKKEKEYYSGPGEDGDYYKTEDNETSKSEYTITLTQYNGTENQVAYVDDELRDTPLGGMADHVTLKHDKDYAYDADQEEKDIAIYTYYAKGDSGLTLTMYHNNKFSDFIGSEGIDGTWEGKDGEFTLKTDDGQEYKLSIGKDDMGTTAQYQRGDETLELKNNTGKGDVVLVLEGKKDSDKVTLTLKDDNTAEVKAGKKVVDTGYYTLISGMIPRLSMKNAGNQTVTYGSEDGSYSIVYNVDGADVELTLKN